MTKTKIKRSSALLLAVCMLFSMALNSISPTYAADPPESRRWDVVYGSTVYGLYVNDVLDTNGEFYYALGTAAFNAGNVSQAYRFEDASGNAQYFAYLTNAIDNIFYDLTGEYGQTNKWVCGGEFENPALEVILVSYEAGNFLAGPYVTTGGQEFYYMDAPAGNAQGAVGDGALQGYESGALTDVTVLWDGTSVTVTPERLYPEGKEPNVPTTGITLDKSTLALAVGGSEQLTATIEPPAATNQNVVWSSNNTGVATVSSAGVVTAIAPGTATIFADTEDGGHTASCTVTVTAATVPVTSVTLNRSTAALTVGNTENLTATVNPSNATNKNVTWSSNNTTVATVSSAGVVTARAVGTATITVTTTDGSKTANCVVTVTAVTVPTSGITLNKDSTSIAVGSTETLTATVTPPAATNQKVVWSSNNTAVATVSSTGVVTARTVGTAIIFAETEDGGHTASCTVTVTAATVSVTSVSLNRSTAALTVGGTENLTATVNPSNATNQNVTWSSNNTTAATVSSAGVVTARATGTATITVTTADGGHTATCVVTVTAATVPVTGVTMSPTIAAITVGGTRQLTATIAPTNATNKNVTWSSNNTTVATVSASGVVTARAAGTATITVTTVDGSKTANCIVNITNPIAIGPDGNGDYYKAVGTPPNVFEVVRDAQGTPNVPATYVYDPDGNPLNGGTVPATKFGSDYYVEAPSTIFHKIDASGTYNPNSGIWGGADGKLGGGDDETTISSGDGNWYCHMSQNIYKVVIRASTSGPVMVGGGEDLDPTTSPVTPVGYSSQLGQYIIGPFYDDDGGQYYYSDPIGGNGRIESDATGPKGDDVIWYVGLDGLLTTVKPLRSLICDLFE